MKWRWYIDSGLIIPTTVVPMSQLSGWLGIRIQYQLLRHPYGSLKRLCARHS